MADLPDDILEQIESIPGCDGIIFTGSRQQGNATDSSDWDFYVLLEDGFDCFKKTWAYDNTFIEVFANTLESINKNDLDITKFPNPAVTMLATGTIIMDNSGRMKEVQSSARIMYDSGPPALSESQRVSMAYSLKNFIDDLVSLDELNAKGYYLQDKAVTYSVECFYKLNKKWTSKPKDVEADLTSIDPEWASIYDDVHNIHGNERIQAIISLIELLASKHDLTLNGLDMQTRDRV